MPIESKFMTSIFEPLHEKPTICIGENKATDQLRGDREADQRLCFRYTDSTIPLLPKSEILSFWPASVTVQAGLCQACSEPKLLVFSHLGSFVITEILTMQYGRPW